MSDFHTGLWNSILIGVGTAVLSVMFATLVTAAVFLAFAVMYILMRYRIVSFGHREKE